MANGVIIGYKLYYILDQNSDDSEAELVVINDPTQAQYLISSLEVYTQYRVWMKASTIVGDGPSSTPVVGRTGESGELYQLNRSPENEFLLLLGLIS